MQYKVPQNVDIEDKVIAGLTLRQFMFLMVSGGLILLLYYFFNTAIPALNYLFMPSALFIGALGVSLAFVKINDRPFEEFLISAGKTLITPSQRIWEKEITPEKTESTEVAKEEKTSSKRPVGEIRSNLQQLAMLVDSGGIHEWDDPEPRLTNVKTNTASEPQSVEDILEKTEKPSEKLSKYFNKAAKEVTSTKKEPTISAVASKNTAPEDFKYENIELANETALEEILDKAREDQLKKEDELENAKVKKFERQ